MSEFAERRDEDENNNPDEVDEEEDENSPEKQVIQEEYRVWKKNSPYLYDFVMTYSLDWPSLTTQWLPDHIKASKSSSDAHDQYSQHKLILGTQSDGTDQNYLMIADVLLPSESMPVDARKYDDERGEVGGFGGTLSKINIKIKINHDGDVHRARYMPQNSFMIATKSPNPTVLVFDYSKHDSIPTDNICRPQYRCHGHTEDGYGISWNPHTKGQLLSASSDGSICIWDIKEACTDVNALHTFRGHGDKGVEDVDWSKHHSTVFASVGDDSGLCFWDLRDIAAGSDSSAATLAPSRVVSKAHDGDVNCVSFSPFDEYLVATGGSDSLVKLWDMRNLSHSLHDLSGHNAGVYQLSWAPFDETVIGSSGEDRRVVVWDTSRIGQEQSPEDAVDGPPELLFVHGGHTSKVFDFSWNCNENWYISSVAEDNVLQVWNMASTIYSEDDDEENDLNDDDLEDTSDNQRNKKQKI